MEKILDKIRKLLKLSESSNQNEAEVALRMANDLMRKHSVSDQDVKDNPEAGKVTHEVVSLNSSSEWVLTLAWGLCKAFGVQGVSTGTKQVRRGRKNKFRATQELYCFGTAGKIATVKLMHQFAVETVNRLTKKERRRIKDEEYILDSNGRRMTVRSYMSSYRNGVVHGMDATLREIEKQNRDTKTPENREYGLVHVADLTKATALRDEMFPNLTQRKRKLRGDMGIYNNGRAAGRNVGFHKQTGSGGRVGLLKK